jgi:hypothetical protein
MYYFVYGLCNGNANTAAERFRWRFLQQIISDDVTLVTIHRQFRESRCLPSVPSVVLRKRKNTFFIRHGAAEYPMSKHYTMKDCNRIIRHELNNMNLGPWVGDWNSDVGLTHVSTCIAILYSLTRDSLHTMKSTVPPTSICGPTEIHKEQ